LLLAASSDARPAPLTRHGGRRVTAAEAYLWPISDDPARRARLVVRTDVAVDRVEFDTGGTASGVVLVDGSAIAADAVVLAAGAIHSPAILQRSGIEGAGVGLRDHPAIGFTLKLRPDAATMPDPSRLGLATASLVTAGPIQTLALNHLGATSSLDLGMLLVALMKPTGNGGTVTVTSDDPRVAPRVDFDMLGSADDRAALRNGVRTAVELLRRPPFAAAVESVFIDDRGTDLATLGLDDDDRLDAWLLDHTADYVHASSSCAGVVDVGPNGDGRVDGHERLFVCDASTFPDIPDVNTHLPTMMLAERLARRWVDMAGSDDE